MHGYAKDARECRENALELKKTKDNRVKGRAYKRLSRHIIVN
jgi:hypothetical protein